MAGRTLADLPNLGPTIVARLRESGITSVGQLARVGPAEAYRRMCVNAGRTLPRCYYLYSLAGALRGTHWSTLTRDEKRRLSLAAEKGGGPRPRKNSRR
jgi:DNA transformation protein